MNMDSLTRQSPIYWGPMNDTSENGSANDCRMRQLSSPVPGTFVPGAASLEVSRCSCEITKKSLTRGSISAFKFMLCYVRSDTFSAAHAKERGKTERGKSLTRFTLRIFACYTCIRGPMSGSRSNSNGAIFPELKVIHVGVPML